MRQVQLDPIEPRLVGPAGGAREGLADPLEVGYARAWKEMTGR